MADENSVGGADPAVPSPGPSDPSSAPVDGAAVSPPSFGQSRYQLGPDDRPTVPKLFSQDSVPPGFWEAPQNLGVAAAVDLPERRDRRRGAFLAVGVVALATVVVVAAALLIGPHLGGSTNNDNQQAAPPVTPSSSSRTAASTALPSTAPTTSAQPEVLPTSAAAPSPSVRTVTVTADPTTATSDAAGETTRARTAPTTSRSSTPSTRTSTKAASPYGVPIQEIACGDGYIVQLASELTAASFARRVADLKAKGMVPPDAKAADSTKSCKLFTNQTNTLILYAGPFGKPYDACHDRLAGPYDAFIRGANPKTAAQFVSCICPAKAGDLPRLSKSSPPDQWIGELQHMLAAHLRYSIPDLGVGTWGTYTPDTRSAVRRFQSDHHLKATGTVDGKTWAALQHAGC